MTDLARTAVIVGAGPAGLLLAHYLLQRHYQVAIYERRADPRQVPAAQQRSFPISLQMRGQKALRGISGLEAVIAQRSLFCQGTMLHSKRGTRDIQRREKVMAVDRHQLVMALLEALSCRYSPPDFTIAFGCRCDRLDDETVTFQKTDGETIAVPYERLVGADGARSRVRSQLAERYGFSYEQSYVPDAYKSIFLLRKNREENGELAADRIHASNLGNDVRIILAPQPGDRLHGAFIFNEHHNPLEDFSKAEQVLTYFEENLPAFRPLLSYEEAEALLKRPVARLTTVRCDRFHQGEQILLIGDAIHAVSPSIGQGCNAALQDVWIFDQLLERCEDDWGGAIAQFSQVRLADAYALRELSDYTFPRTKGLVLEFFVRLLLGRKLHQWFPNWFPPFLFDQVLETDMGYAEILQMHRRWINKVKQATTAAATMSQPL